MEVLFYVLLFIVGACFGSFLCCQARRLHLRSQKGTKKLGSRSVCLHCRAQLKWYDNLPIISWLALKGKCRKCHRKIGLAEFLSELGTALAFVGIGFAFLQVYCSSNATTLFGLVPPQDVTSSFCGVGPINWVAFIITLIFTLIFTLIVIFLAIYDGLYGQLSTVILIMAIIAACILLILRTTTAPFSSELIWQPLLAILILGGLYLVLYFVSRGKWVGDGDWLLGTAIAIALGSPWLALIVLFLSNFFACFIMLPTFIKHRQHKIYFGPFMVIAYVITITFADFLQSMI